MIEIVYDKDEQTEESVFWGISLPKNIRQIGIPAGNRRIYIEDYVMTYLKQLANPNSTFARGAILVGECVHGENGDVVFVSGALPAQNLELDLREDSFAGETWSYIYQEVKHYFPDLEVVGWFLSRMGFSTEVNDMIVKLHMDNFAGRDKVLFIMDELEGEEAFYMMEEEGLHRQSGYYIYYARNEAMQSFMIATKQDNTDEESNPVEEKDEAVVRNYKRIMEERAKNARIERMNRRLSGACQALAVAVLALGIAVFSNYQMLGKLQQQLEDYGIFAMENEPRNTSDTEEVAQTMAKDEEQIQNNAPKKVVDTSSIPKYYTVQNGDTLSSISFKMYNSVGYVAELMEANELGEADDIHEGDRIVIPTVKSND